MNRKSLCFYLIALILIIGIAFTQEKKADFPLLTGPYLGQKPPGMTPVIFAAGIISTEKDAEYGGHFSPDGNDFYFTRYSPGELAKLWVSEYRKNKWTTPREVSFIEEFPGGESCFSPDGKKFYYVWVDTLSKEFAHDIFVVEIGKKGWGIPHQLTKTDLGTRRMSPSVARNGNLYFSGNFDEPGQKDIYCAKLINEKYSEPQNLGKTVNSEYHEEHVFVSPDESYILFDSYRPSKYGRSDIYVSYKMGDGSWSEAQNLGTAVNSEHYDWYPSVTPDGRYIIFSRTLPSGKIDLYWVNAKIIDRYKPSEIK